MKNILLLLLLLLADAGVSFAQIPRTISYQGDLRTHQGTPISDGQHILSFSIYDSPLAVAPIYSEAIITNVHSGIFTTVLGSQKPLPDSLLFDRAYFLGIGIDGSAEMSPRTALTSVPYALHASLANGLTPDAVIPGGLVTGSAAPSGPALGDLWGTYPYPQVVGLQSRPISLVLPQPGDVFIWNGGTWGPGKVPDPVAFHVGATSFANGQINFNISSGSTYFTEGNYFDSISFNVPETGVYRFDMNTNAIETTLYSNSNPEYIPVNVYITVDEVRVDVKNYSQLVTSNEYPYPTTIPLQYYSLIKLNAGQRVKFYVVFGDNNRGFSLLSADLVGFKLK